MRTRAATALLLSLLALRCGQGGDRDGTVGAKASDATTGAASSATASPAGASLFVERAAAVGLDFFHFNGRVGTYHMAEITGAGGALFDYDRDGDLDVYLVQGGPLEEGGTLEGALDQPRHPLPLSDRLYRNDMKPGDPASLRFTDVTVECGLAAIERGYGMGAAVGDYDNDGWPDVYLTNLGPNQLLRNRGDGTFEDTTAKAGVGEDRWSVPATFFDYDEDGWLDLFVGNYLQFDAKTAPRCEDAAGALDYCGPNNFAPLPDRLFHNRGDGTFEDTTRAAGLRAGFGPALGAVAADYDGDGDLDLYVTNDGMPNNLWTNRGGGRFEDSALLDGAAVDAGGRAGASMGVDAGDYDGDGDLDLFVTKLISEGSTLWRNESSGSFADITTGSGLGGPSRLHTGFGAAWIDIENDGWLDLFVANGAVKKIESLARQGDPFPLHERDQLFRSVAVGGARSFVEVMAEEAGDALALSEVSRGAIVGDVDSDGDLDLVVTNNLGPVRLLINHGADGAPWLGVELRERAPRRDAPGASIKLALDDGDTLLRRVRIDGSYACSNDPRVLFGLAGRGQPKTVRVTWADGEVEEWDAPATGRYTELQRGGGRPVS